MKKFISVMLCVCICLSSSVFCFADFTSTDSTTLSNIYKYMPTASQVTTLNNTLSTISSRTLNIYNTLFADNHSIAYWVEAINSWMSPIYGRLSDIITNTLNIEAVVGLLGETDVVNGTTVRTPYLKQILNVVGNYGNGKSVTSNSWSADEEIKYAHRQLFEGYHLGVSSSGKYKIPIIRTDGSIDFNNDVTWQLGSPLGNLALITDFMNYNFVSSYSHRWTADLTGYNSSQSGLSWEDIEQSITFTPQSQTDGLYKWLKYIQAPVARMSYVLASDERIEAQEKAAANEQAVVDNFIDSSGSGSASTSDFGSVSDLSSGFKDNISTDASVSGIWNIFNSDNFGWFSQETADQLDTSGSGNRTLRSYGNYPTPLLDQQTEDILKYIGGDNK